MPATRAGRPALLALVLFAAAVGGQPPPADPKAPPADPKMPADPKAAPAAEKPPEPPKLTDKLGGRDAKDWLKELKESPDGQLRELAVKTLPLYGKDIRKDALKPLVAAIRDTDSGVRINAIIALGLIGAENDAEAKEIADALSIAISTSGPGAPSRLYAARSLGGYGPRAASAVRTLAGIAADPSWETRATVAQALAQVGQPDRDKEKGPSQEALDALTKRLREEKSAVVRQEVIDGLILLGPPKFKDAAEYVKVIRPHLDAVLDRQKVEKDKTALVWLQFLHMAYDGSQVNEKNVEKLGKVVSDPDPAPRVAALRALAMLGPDAKPALSMMEEALKDPEPEMVAQAVTALAALEKTASSSLPALEKLQKEHKDQQIQKMAGAAIDMIKGKKPVAPAPPAPPPAKK